METPGASAAEFVGGRRDMECRISVWRLLISQRHPPPPLSPTQTLHCGQSVHPPTIGLVGGEHQVELRRRGALEVDPAPGSTRSRTGAVGAPTLRSCILMSRNPPLREPPSHSVGPAAMVLARDVHARRDGTGVSSGPCDRARRATRKASAVITESYLGTRRRRGRCVRLRLRTPLTAAQASVKKARVA